MTGVLIMTSMYDLIFETITTRVLQALRRQAMSSFLIHEPRYPE